jgi:hypothetical protein
MADLSDFRTYIRNHLDLTAADLTDDIVDEFIREGALMVQYARQRWHFYQTTWTLTTAIDQGAYNVETDPVSSPTGYVVAEIKHLYRPDGTEIFFDSVDVADGGESSGNPESYRTWGTTLTLVPTPTAIEAIQVVGYRKPVDWVDVGAGEMPDTPAVFDGVIRLWALGRAYAHQEDHGAAGFYSDHASFHLDRLVKQLDDLPPGRIIMNSSGPKTNYWVTKGTELQYPRIVT